MLRLLLAKSFELRLLNAERFGDTGTDVDEEINKFCWWCGLCNWFIRLTAFIAFKRSPCVIVCVSLR